MVKEKMIFSDLQKNIWERLYRIKSNDRVGSAYCFSGPTGSGKEYAAIEFAKLLNCEKFEEIPCNKCPSCLSLKAYSILILKLLFLFQVIQLSLIKVVEH